MPINYLSISNLPAIYLDGLYRVLGCVPSSPESKAEFPSFAAEHRSAIAGLQWREIDLSHYNPTIENQGTSSSCVGWGCGSGMEVSWMQMGRQKKEFSAWFLYGLINNGRDRGAMISDALRSLMSVGICPKEDVAPGLMYKHQFSQRAFESAKSYKLLKAFRCDSFDEICAALSLGFTVPLGIMVGSNFPSIDGNGIAPLPGRGGGGHCILGCGLKNLNGEWLVKIFNSWGKNFGMNGYCYLRREHFSRINPDAFAIQLMSDPQGSGHDVPTVKS